MNNNEAKELGYGQQLSHYVNGQDTSDKLDTAEPASSASLEISNFKKAVRNLNSISKTGIESITSLVKDTTLVNPEEIVDILIQCQSEGLITLYIMDCIMKTVGQDYTNVISKQILKIFESTFIKVDISTRRKMYNLRHTWNGVLSLHLLLKVDQAIHNIDNAWPIYCPEKRENDDNESLASTQELIRTQSSVLTDHGQTQILSSHWDPDFDEDNIPSTQALLGNAVKKEKNMWDGTHGVIKKSRHSDVQSNTNAQIDFGSQTLATEFNDVIKILSNANKKQTNKEIVEIKPKDDDFVVPRKESKKWNRVLSDEDGDFVVASPKDVKKKSRVPKAAKKNDKIIDAPCVKAAKRIRLAWIPCDVTYIMSTELFDYITDDNQEVIRENFKYRKHSIGIEMSKLFPGCVIYVDKYYEAKNFWRLQAYCSHLECRNYRFIAQYDTPNLFQVEFDRPIQMHKKPIARQLRNYERCKVQETSSSMPNLRRAREINASNKDLISKGDYDGVVSEGVLQKARKEGLAKQDLDRDDIADVEAMQTTDENTNFISKTLGRTNYAVYIHSKSQHNILNKLHKKRSIDGVPIIGRLDTTGGIARDVTDDKLLYSALTVNIKIKNDKKSTPLPLTEEYNVRNTSKDISEWLFNFISAHNSFHENPPLLLDYLVSDFSYANFHATLLSFNATTLRKYLEVSYNWILFKMENSEFPESFNLWVKIRMCYTHIMHTFGDMTKRHYGKSDSGAQLPQSRVILEILAAMVKATNYNVLLGLFQQMVILLSNQYENDYVQIAALKIKRITSPIEEKLLAPAYRLR